MREYDTILASDKLAWLTDMYMVDYFVCDHWRTLPKSWTVLSTLTNSEWSCVLDGGVTHRVLPLGVLAMRVVAVDALRRQPVDSPQDVAHLIGLNSARMTSSFRSVCCREGVRRRIKAKKQHEIDRIIDTVHVLRTCGVHDVLSETRFGSAIDIGAGLGHLTRVLTMELGGLRVAAVEANEQFTSTALRLDAAWQGRGEFSAPIRATEFVTADTQPDVLRDDSGQCILGIHPCGSLGANLCRIFCEWETARALLLLSCCWHKMDGGRGKEIRQKWAGVEEKNDEGEPSFPLSAAFADARLSYAARELACHAKEQYVEQLQTESGTDTQEFRSVLEWLLVECARPGRNEKNEEKEDETYGLEPYEGWESRRHWGLRGVKRTPTMAFEEYAERALSGGREDEWERVKGLLSSSARARRLVCSLDGERERGRLQAIRCLRMLAAPIVEALLLRDRLCFLKERGFSAHLVPLFDPAISPRNVAIIAYK